MEVFEYPILKNKHYQQPSVFRPENLIREARRQKGLKTCNIPEICVLDPDGDLAEYLIQSGKAKKNNCWACYHSKLYNFQKEVSALSQEAEHSLLSIAVHFTGLRNGSGFNNQDFGFLVICQPGQLAAIRISTKPRFVQKVMMPGPTRV